jgi:hypothetical protein
VSVSGLPQLPALVVGEVTHHRLGPVRHAFRHRVYQWLVDLDAVPVQPFYLRPLASVSSADHLGDPRRTIKENIQRHLAGEGLPLGPGSRIVMLANARVLGHVFDPLTVFWCYAGDGTLACVLAEVHNTYGERHTYLLRPDTNGTAHADKAFYVSPFFDVSGTYTLRFALRPDVVSTAVTLRRNDTVAFSAAFRGRPRPATRGALLATFLRQPFMPHRVSTLIRLHGIRLWLHRLPVIPRPSSSPREAT